VTRTETGLGSLVGKHEHAVQNIHEHRRRNHQWPWRFARNCISCAILRVHDVSQFLSVYLQNYLDRKSRGILGQTNKLLIVHSEGAERPGLAKPVRLRIRSIVWNPVRQILRNEFVRRKSRIDFV
jgi:hypothetical protein